MNVYGTEALEFIANSQISVLPLLLMMGVLAAAAGLSEDIYNIGHAGLGKLRGGLALATIGGCAGFGAVTGSSIATAATISRIALPELQRRAGHLFVPDRGFHWPIVRCGDRLSVPLAALLYMLTVSAYVRFFPASAPGRETVDWSAMVRASRRGITVIGLFVLVMGGMYAGTFTATEAASVGAVTAFLIALCRGKLKEKVFWEVMGETSSITAMVYALIIGGLTFSCFVGITGLPELMTDTVGGLAIAPKAIIAIFLVVFVLLGAVMEAFAIPIITAPILSGLIVDLGFDLIWWGIIMVAVVEIGVITPPFGINVFVLRSVAGADVSLATVFQGVMPFVLSAFAKLAILVPLPALVLWLPSTMF